jgi:serine/threonine protein kinase
MLEIASAVRGFDPAWLKTQIEAWDLGVSHSDRRQLFRNLFLGRVEERLPVTWDEFRDFGFTCEELDLRAECDRVFLGQEFDQRICLEARIATGGVAVVYRGRLKSDNRPVAVKIPKFVADDPDDEHARLLVGEAELLQQLSVEGIPQFLELRHETFGPMLVLEWVETNSGHGIPASAPRETRLRWIAEIARTLDRIHQRDLIHGDVKMENILIDQEGKAWLTDFNVTRPADPRSNRDGIVPGTHSQMSQEALVGVASDADISQDLYALGAVLYQTLSGKRLVKFSEREAALVASVLVGGVHEPKFSDEVATELKKIVQTATSRHIQLRFSTAGDFADTVDRFLDGTLTVNEIPPLRRGLHAWQGGSRLASCMMRHRTLQSCLVPDTSEISAEHWRQIRNDIGQGTTAALAAEELEQNVFLLQWSLPPCPCINSLMEVFYRHPRLAKSELPTVRALATEFEGWLRETCKELEANVSRQDPRNYLLFATAMQARLASSSLTARTKWPQIAAMAGLADVLTEPFCEFLKQNSSDQNAWAMALQGLDFSVVKWIRWGIRSESSDQTTETELG